MEEYIKQLEAKLKQFEAELKLLKANKASREDIMYCQGEVGTFYYCLRLAKSIHEK